MTKSLKYKISVLENVLKPDTLNKKQIMIVIGFYLTLIAQK